jgi:hypothetical protein
MSWDVFISHAREDKEAVARPLATQLAARGVKVWLDAYELVLGDSLRKKIDEGLAQSRWGVVILSPSFFRKPWARAELDALVSRELDGEKTLLPVWHQITATEVARSSPLLAARLGVSTSDGIDRVCDAILSAIGQAFGPTAVSPADTGALADVWFRAFADRDHERSTDFSQRQLGAYRIQKQIGRGGSGIVFRALQVHLFKTVALKVLYPLDDRDRAVTRAAERGLRGLAAARHPSLLAPIDVGYLRRQQQVSLFIVGELIDGTDLTTWSSELDGADAQRRRIEAAIQLAEALEVAHDCRFVGDLGFQERGVLHGDIKPHNIVVDKRSQRPVLLDFMLPDIHRLLHPHPQPAPQPAPRSTPDDDYHYGVEITAVFGTPGYMAPEQAIDGIVSETADIYSLGRTFLGLFWPPKHNGGAPEVYTVAVAAQGTRGKAEQALALLVDAMTRSDPGGRPPSMSDVRESLQRCLGLVQRG